jgi:two-component system alkaline phosphatase synthesis response regulator PhoP
LTTLLSSVKSSSSATLGSRSRALDRRAEDVIAKTKTTILVVDDDSDIRELIQLTLSSFGYESETAADAEDALAKVRRGAVSLVTVDLAMPRRDGHWLLRELTSEPSTSSIPVIVISAYAGRLDRTPQVIAVLWKPFDVDELVQAVESTIGPPPS